jgi:WD40 repeat protein/DNA-binding SARP family transcriptional activator
MGIAVLGPLLVDGQVDGLSPRDRVVLSALVVRLGEPTTTEALADALWGERLPTSWPKVVQGCVVRLRKRLGVGAIESGPLGYRLTLSDDELDTRRFERLVQRGRAALEDGDPARSSYLLSEALDLWRGRALADLDEWEPARAEVVRLEELRMRAEELRVEAETEAGHGQEVLDRARWLVDQAPYRERRWALLARALYQAGRQEEALGTLKQARDMLVDELGLDPGPELAELEHRVLRQDPSLVAPVRHEVSAECPYRGLLPYDAEDSDSFFGREADEEACLRRLRDARVLAVVGPSGIGKSSLVRAGVVAALVRRGTRVLVTTPGPHPLDSLAGLAAPGRQTLVVDQAEEAVTLCTDPGERAGYFAALASHVGAGGALVLSLRADHIGGLAPYPDMARVLEDGLYLLGPMSEEDLRNAIERPARRAGLRLEAGLVDLLVRDVEGEPAALPMLSHVLRETWQQREGPTLTVDGYRATGGIRYAVARSAEALYEGMDPSQRSGLRHLLLRLVIPTDDGDPVRARVPRAKIAVDEEHARLVEQLVDARLVSVDGDSVQIAHEALVKVWPRLRDWLDEDVEGQHLFRHLSAAADAWDGMGRPESELYRGGRLSSVLEWRERAAPDLDETEQAFLAASVALSESELRAAEIRIAQQRTTNRRLRSALGGVGVVLVLALVAGFLAARSGEQARHQRDRAEAAASLAEARRVGAQALTNEDPATSLLLGLAALKMDDSAQERDNLASTLTRLGSLQKIRRTGGSAVSLAVSGDGTSVAVSLAKQGVQLFDVPTLARSALADRAPARAVAFSPHGHLMAAAVTPVDLAGTPQPVPRPVHLYDVATGTLSFHQLGGWRKHDNVGYALAFSRDGSRIVAGVNQYVGGTGPARVMVWDVDDPSTPVFRARVPSDPQVALSPDGRVVYTATAGDDSVRAYDVDSKQLLRQTPANLVAGARKGAMDVSPDGSTLAVAAGSRVLRFDTGTLARESVLRGHTAEVTEVEYSHDGSMLLSTSADRSAIVRDTRTGAIQKLAAHNEEVWGGAFSPDDHTVYTASGDGTLMSWDLTGHSDLLSHDAADVAEQQIGVSLAAPDGVTVARIVDDQLWFTNTQTGETTPRSPVQTPISAHAWSPDSHWLVTTLSKGLGQLSVWDAWTGRLVSRPPKEFPQGALAAFSADSDTIYVDDRSGHLEALDRENLDEVEHTTIVGTSASELVPDPVDGSVLALRRDGSVARIDPVRETVIKTSHEGRLLRGDVQAATFAPDGRLLAAARPDGSMGLLDPRTFEWVGKPSRTPWDYDVVYAPDGSQLASVQSDRIRLWDGRTGAYQASIPLPDLPAIGQYSTGHTGPGSSIAYLPDSTGLLVTSADGRTWTVDTRTSTWKSRACGIAGRNLTQSEWQRFFPGRRYQVVCPQ